MAKSDQGRPEAAPLCKYVDVVRKLMKCLEQGVEPSLIFARSVPQENAQTSEGPPGRVWTAKIKFELFSHWGGCRPPRPPL